MAHPMVFSTPAPAHLFRFPPAADPQPIPPPTNFSAPFTIPDWLFSAALEPKVPLTIAITYAVSAKLLNVYNKSTNKKPWAISQTQTFKAFVIFHNIFLAVYSAWTWWGMLNALSNTIVSPFGPNGWAGTIDSFCKPNGPAGLGNAISFNEALGRWETPSSAMISTAAAAPDRDVYGRLWNEGLAFYGWIFYLSKFYEVLDTFIILAKGKLSSTLQTYHHAGAMMAMWGGIRYMASPIWLFCFFNSFIHSLMYTYYTVTAFNIRVPQVIKRTLTSMQISQFILGASVATLHSFVAYTVPVEITNTKDNSVETQYQVASCLTTSGSTFAVWLNIVYLLPLTYLFVSFFITSYMKRSQANVRSKTGGRRLSNVTVAEKAGWDAAKGINREVYGGNSTPVTPVEEKSPLSGFTKINGNGKKH
jgi:hypothetical protein